MPTETQNRPSRIHLEKCFPEREWPKTHIALVTESAPGRRRSTAPPRQASSAPQAGERMMKRRGLIFITCGEF